MEYSEENSAPRRIQTTDSNRTSRAVYKPLLSSAGSQPALHQTDVHVLLSRSVRIEPGTNWINSALILTNIVLGVGLLNFPRAYHDAGGIWAFLLIQTVVVIFILVGLVLLGACTDASGRDTFQGLVKFYGGPWAHGLCNLFIFVHNFGTCITFLIIIADQLDKIVLVVFEHSCQRWYLDRTFTLPVLSIVLILPACFPKNISDFKISAYIGGLTTTYIMILVIWKFVDSLPLPQDVQLSGFGGSFSWIDVFKVVPTIAFSFEGHIELVPLYACMKKRSLVNLTKVVVFSILLSLGVYTLVGVLGLLSFGDKVATDMITNYDATDPVVIVAMVAVTIKAIITYPIILFCTRLVADDVMRSFAVCADCSERLLRYLQCLVLFGASLVLATLVPSIGSVISLLGFTGVMFVFVFPGYCFLQENIYWTSKWHVAKCLVGGLFVLAGAFLAGTTITLSIQRILMLEFSAREVACRA